MGKPLTFLTEETIKSFKAVSLQPDLDIPFHSTVQLAEIPLTVSDFHKLVSLNISVGWKVDCYFNSLSLTIIESSAVSKSAFNNSSLFFLFLISFLYSS